MTVFLDPFEQGCHAIILYIYNTSGHQFALDIFGRESAEVYLREKADAWARSPAMAIGYLDRGNMKKLWAIAKERYKDMLGPIQAAVVQ